ncbi:MAG: hypothetical protein IPG81_10190 [Sandaracinaceae bacterium]|nr:hypothetical protein [Sandaracinaceae bacterium]
MTTTTGSNLNDADDYFRTSARLGQLRPQELSLVFVLDLNACVSDGDPPMPPVCTPADDNGARPGVNDACGYLSDGCGGLVDRGGCASGETTATARSARPATCTPQSCSQQGYACGQFPDGCGGIADGAMTDTCGNPPPARTAARTVSARGCVHPERRPLRQPPCGNASDGCGQTEECGFCAPNEFCTASGICIGFE